MIARVQISKHLYTLPHVIVNIPTVIGNVEVFVWKTCEWKIFKTTRTNSEKIVVYLHGVPRKDSYSFPCLLHPTPTPHTLQMHNYTKTRQTIAWNPLMVLTKNKPCFIKEDSVSDLSPLSSAVSFHYIHIWYSVKIFWSFVGSHLFKFKAPIYTTHWQLY